MIRVLHEDNHVLCLEKPVNVPVMADSSHDEDLLTAARQYLKEKYNKPGNVFLGLVHRLDRPVGGVMVFAKTSKAASRLSDSIRQNKIEKRYLAVLDGVMKEPNGTLRDYLYKDTRTNTVRVTDKTKGKYSVLHYETLAVRDGHSLVEILLETGRPHQIRVQFSSRGCPLMYDQRYHPHPKKGQIALYAYSLCFPHPTKDEMIRVVNLPPYQNPWNIFEKEIYDRQEKIQKKETETAHS